MVWTKWVTYIQTFPIFPAFGSVSDIASQLIDNKDLIDVSFGGGTENFVPKGFSTQFGGTSKRQDKRDLIREWELNGGKFVFDSDSMTLLKKLDAPVLGLFSDSHKSYEAAEDRHATEPTLQNITKKALDLLSEHNSPGFFLMVEGGRIDHAQHSNNPYLMVTEGKHFIILS